MRAVTFAQREKCAEKTTVRMADLWQLPWPVKGIATGQ